ncbi:MAG TPA: hypothetical protein DCZ01_07285 [Elusimicrobia bacterium]|nr:MAG: hypothetical protein A2X37_06685 [Elusimicrobia bacterium GWA2_66_18]OGR69804.1 MAG: hypothetical protein A2X40_01835 [Elusimicrobia bacterium GWC2_65_9]HAZ08310.1 hypothetical protein [Elusimicrobiota bacterium]
MNRKRLISAVLYLAFAAPARAGSDAFNQLKAAAGTDVLPSVRVPAWPATRQSSGPAPTLPDEMTVHERVISLVDTFDLKAGDSTLGTITRKFFSLTKAFTYIDAKDNCIAKARARLLSWGAHIDVTDCSDLPIGAIKENVLKSFFKVYTQYSMLDSQGAEIATSEKVDWISTDLTIRRPDGRTVATLHRPWLNIFSDNWTVKIADHAAVDSRLIVMIAAYKTSVDNDRRKEREEKRKQ